MKESDLVKAILLAAPQFRCRLFRNNVGVLKDARGNYVKYGLCVGSSDLIGWTPKGHILAVEVKRPGQRASLKQRQFLQAVNQAGGLGLCVDNLDDFKTTLNTYLTVMKEQDA